LQYDVMAAVAKSSANIPVPVLGAFETDSSFLGVPFFVMYHVDGQVPADNLPYTMDADGWVLKATDGERETLWWSGLEALAEIAKVDHTTLGLDFLDRPEFGASGIAQQLGYYRAFLDASSGGRPQPTTEAIWSWLIEHRPTSEGPLGLSWGDARIGNIIWNNFRPAAVVDWEMASFAPAELDLGWFLYFNRQFTEGLGLEPVPGFASREASIARFEELIGRSVHDLEWFEVFAGFRFGVIMLRLTDLLIQSGVLPADTDMGTNNLATQFTSMLLGLPTPAEMDAEAKKP
jgi:aminoglycoside phosphotransferase (APT) family kinase protein